jgi:hypothetical protein
MVFPQSRMTSLIVYLGKQLKEIRDYSIFFFMVPRHSGFNPFTTRPRVNGG